MIEKRAGSCGLSKGKWRGFSLIEVMIVVVIIGILAAVAYPSYTEYVYKGRRGYAIAALLKIQQAQERWRSNNPTYGTLAQLAAYGVTANSEKAYYGLTVSNPVATQYSATATLKSGTAQSNDGKCTSFTVTMSAGTITYSSTGTATSNYCWGR